MPKRQKTLKSLITSTPRESKGSPLSREPDIDTRDPFLGFPEYVDLSSHSHFCSFVLESFDASQKLKIKKRMTKAEATKKTEIYDLCKKVNCTWFRTVTKIHRTT